MGVYFQPWNLEHTQQHLLRNMFVLMIAPFGCSTADILKCLEDETLELGAGVMCELDGKPTRLLMFPLAITGDMPQQNHNCGVMLPTSRHSCHGCLVSKDQRGDLDFDTVWNGRYQAHHQHRFKVLSKDDGRSQAEKTAGFSSFGISKYGHVFEGSFPFLDPFSSYPSNPMHSELRLAKYFLSMLMKNILSKHGIDAYLEA